MTRYSCRELRQRRCCSSRAVAVSVTVPTSTRLRRPSPKGFWCWLRRYPGCRDKVAPCGRSSVSEPRPPEAVYYWTATVGPAGELTPLTLKLIGRLLPDTPTGTRI